jgi:hypothetical protein
MPARTGKIASLPQPIREQLNQRLRDGESGAQILPWLNEESARALADHPRWAGDTTINDNALSNWRNGGYIDWCRDLAKLDLIEKKVELAARIAALGGNINDTAAQIMAGDLLEVLDATGGTVQGGANDGDDQPAGPDKIGLALAVAKLLDANAKSRVAGVAEQKLTLDKTKVAQAERKIEQALSKLRLEWQRFAGKFLDWAEDQRAKAILDQAGSSRAQKIAALADLFGEMPDGIGPSQI